MTKKLEVIVILEFRARSDQHLVKICIGVVPFISSSSISVCLGNWDYQSCELFSDKVKCCIEVTEHKQM